MLTHSCSVQAVRVQSRFDGFPVPCSSGDYNDRDDLVFSVATGKVTSVSTSSKDRSPILPAAIFDTSRCAIYEENRCDNASHCVWNETKSTCDPLE